MTGRSGKRTIGLLAAAVLGLGLLGGSVLAQENKESPVTAFLQGLKLHGLIQAFGASWDPGTDTFQLRRARLALFGTIVKDLSFKVSFDLAKSVGLLDAQVEYAPFREAGLRFGQFLVPFSLDSVTLAADLDLINRPAVVEALAPSRDIGSAGRDAGVAVFGRWSIAEYAFGLFNGSGLNKADDDSHKDFSGRLVLRPVKFLALGGSLYRGERAPDEGEPLADRNKEGLEAQFDLDRVLVKGEYIHARDGLVEKAGWYATAAVFALPGKLQALVRYDALDLDRAVANDGTRVVAFGLSWFIAGRTKLQVNYEIHGREAGGRETSGLLAQFQAAF